MKKSRSSLDTLQLAWIILSVVLLCPGCRLTYIFHAASGQFRLMRASVPVEQALADESLSAEEKKRLRLVEKVKSFGEEHLGLKHTENYQSVYLDSSHRPIYVISASPKDSLTRKTWWFPVVGRVPYISFFDKDKALAEKEKLTSEDLDVTLGMAEAYSTLGWFKDPVTRSLIQGSTVDMVETILHEMTHTTLYVAGQGEFNEGLAQMVGRAGALRFLKATYGPAHPYTREAVSNMEDERAFCAFLNGFLDALGALYQSDIPYEQKLIRREDVFAQFRREFDQLREEFGTARFSAFGDPKINNAYLMVVSLYHKHFLLFDAVLQEHQGRVGEMLSFFEELAGKKDDMLAATSHWLDRRSLKSAWQGPRTGENGTVYPILSGDEQYMAMLVDGVSPGMQMTHYFSPIQSAPMPNQTRTW